MSELYWKSLTGDNQGEHASMIVAGHSSSLLSAVFGDIWLRRIDLAFFPMLARSSKPGDRLLRRSPGNQRQGSAIKNKGTPRHRGARP